MLTLGNGGQNRCICRAKVAYVSLEQVRECVRMCGLATLKWAERIYTFARRIRECMCMCGLRVLAVLKRAKRNICPLHAAEATTWS
jgi:hypothetical protein